MFRQIIPLMLVVFLALTSCKKPEEYPLEPSITFRDLVVYKNTQGWDDFVRVNISFTDGDGDIGYKEPGQNDPIFDDPSSPYRLNYIGTYSLLRNGVWVYVNTADPVIPLEARCRRKDSIPHSGREKQIPERRNIM